MLQIKPPVFIPANSEQVQYSINILLFMSDFNTEPRPLAVNALSCTSTGLIHYIQIANEHLSLILPTYNITDGGRRPELLPSLLKTFLESPSYTKIGFGAYEDAARIKDQYGITHKNIFDIHWMAKVMGIGSANVGMLHDVFGEVHDDYTPGRVESDGHVSSNEQRGQLIDPRRWDWETHGSIELSRELIRCIAQDAFATLRMYDNIQDRKFKPGYRRQLTDFQKLSDQAREFLLTSVPRGALLPMRSFYHLLKGPFMSIEMNSVDRDAQALALVKLLIENKELVSGKGDTIPITFDDPTVLSRHVALPGVRSSEAILTNSYSRKIVSETFKCQPDELRLMQDSNMSRKPNKIQDLECFLGVYEWLEFLPGADLDEPEQLHLQEPLDRRLQLGLNVHVVCGRKESALLALFLNFGTMTERFKDRPTETKQWVTQRISRLVQQDVLMRTDGPQGLVRINPALLRLLKRIEPRVFSQHVTENKALIAK
ncbi:hypothetical protein BGZ65_006462 [Modicella reniformis]|uniref:3'-5' exonuclease domain-containing protein n=1 Tax=Modicella reniformis TaxID=1440133 RepID=A0A9P6J561_9FUNG|nr:hypothetical protein BGZ65_006462 [Modicella reniformis]